MIMKRYFLKNNRVERLVFKMEKVKVSVIVPVFNTSERYLKKCISSITKQTMKNIEIIIVDDGSAKYTFDAIDSIAQKDKRIQVIHKENGGVSSARNIGLNLAVGEYITFIDSDDWIDLQCLEVAYNECLNKRVDMVSWRFYREYGKKQSEVKIFDEERLEYKAQLSKEKSQYEFPIYDMRIMGYTTMKLYRRELFDNIRYNESLIKAEDVELNFRLYSGIHYAVYINRPFYHYRFVPDSAVRRFDEQLLDQYNATLLAIKEDIIHTKDRDLRHAFMDFTAISYLMICMNFVFSSQNPCSFVEKIEILKNISHSSPYREAIEDSKKLNIPLTRKMALICAKYNFYFGVMCIIKFKRIINKIYD